MLLQAKMNSVLSAHSVAATFAATYYTKLVESVLELKELYSEHAWISHGDQKGSGRAAVERVLQSCLAKSTSPFVTAVDIDSIIVRDIDASNVTVQSSPLIVQFKIAGTFFIVGNATVRFTQQFELRETDVMCYGIASDVLILGDESASISSSISSSRIKTTSEDCNGEDTVQQKHDENVFATRKHNPTTIFSLQSENNPVSDVSEENVVTSPDSFVAALKSRAEGSTGPAAVVRCSTASCNDKKNESGNEAHPKKRNFVPRRSKADDSKGDQKDKKLATLSIKKSPALK